MSAEPPLRGFRFKRLVIIGSRGLIEAQRYRSRIAPKAVLATLSAFEVRWDIPIAFCETPEAAALQIERYAFYFVRESVKRINDLLRGLGKLPNKAHQHKHITQTPK